SRNVQFAVVMYFFLALFIALCAYFCYFVGFKSDDFINSPYNSRLEVLADKVIRGDIVDKNGVVLATSGSDNVRSYPYSNMYAHAIGYNSNGMAGVELDGNFYMIKSHAFFLERIKNDLTGVKNKGDTVVTTLDHKLQETAYDNMNYDGAVIAIEPSTGKILVMTSKPNFNPNTIADNYSKLSSGETSVLLNRATQGLYAPGSTFKIITALEYLQENPNAASSTFDCTGKFTQDNYTIRCYHGEKHGHITFKEAFGESCNIAFSQIGLGLNRNGFTQICNQLLFNQKLPTKLSNTSTSKFSVDDSTRENVMMQTAIGQGQTVVSPLHMCMIAGAICNNGKLMQPYILDSITNYKGINVKSFSGTTVDSILTQPQTDQIKEYMRYVVTDGTATALNSSNYEAYGKTGTAEFADNSDESHAWFVGFATKDDKSIAIAVLQEKGGSGSKGAVPIAKAVFDTYFSQNTQENQNK
ncbi:MAG: penicillin-binding protein 2, partial [Lachnospiraceae bacterium]|nr:penicillin-binding protein 2 [Lachnospiraceae bacterium]